MRTENEFIAGVHEKYERELENRRKRVRALSLGATLSACACVALFVSVRTLPVLLRGNAENENDAAYTYVATATIEDYADCEAELADVKAYSLFADDAIEEAIEEVADCDPSAAAQTVTDEKPKLFKDAPEGTEKSEKVNLSDDAVAEANAQEVCAYPKVDTFGAPKYAGNGAELIMSDVREAPRAQASNGSFRYMLPCYITADAYTVTVNEEHEYIKRSEYSAGSGAVYGECEDGYYVYFAQGEDFILLTLDTDTLKLETVKNIAESVNYIAE